MRLTGDKGFRNFWYPVIPIGALKSGPKAFTLLNENIALWLDESGRPCAIKDECCHRSAKLSCGWVESGKITCPYHAWSYDGTGQCVRVPQFGEKSVPKTYKVPGYHCREKYGYAWVCLGEPARDIPVVPETEKKNYRFFQCFYETWNTSSFRVIENELDMSHFAVVHRGTFGNPAKPLPLSFEVQDLDDSSLYVRAELSVVAPPQQKKNTRAEDVETTRLMEITWQMPFFIRLSITYPSGLHHVILNHPTPIDDNKIQVVQFCFRNDTEKEATVEDVLAFERLILNEDRSVLVTTNPQIPENVRDEAHLQTDQPGLFFRKKLALFLKNSTEEIHVPASSPVQTILKSEYPS